MHIITSDTHFFHAGPLKWARRGELWSSVDEMNHGMIEIWNQTITNCDVVHVVGDFSFGKLGETLDVMRQLNGEKHLVIGNHDKALLKKQEYRNAWRSVSDIKMLKLADPDAHDGRTQRIVLCHYAMRVWDQSHRGSWMLHGHCVDMDTEILTVSGWRSRHEVSVGTVVATVTADGTLGWQPITAVIDAFDRPSAVHIASKGYDMRMTPEHATMCVVNGRLVRVLASDFGARTNRTVPLAAFHNPVADYPIDDDLLRLYIWFVTDGSFENTSLWRFHLKKQRKLRRLRELLCRLGVVFSDNPQRSGTTKINFTRPDALAQLRKPLDPFAMHVSKRQADIIVEEYLHTDGCRTGAGSFQISTSKACEKDILQAMLVLNGYRCNAHLRRSGSWVLSACDRQTANTTKAHRLPVVEDGLREDFWCVDVPNHTFFARRNGKVFITGNSHGNLDDGLNGTLRSMDVGWDTTPDAPTPIAIPWRYDDIKRRMRAISHTPVDHHGRLDSHKSKEYDADAE